MSKEIDQKVVEMRFDNKRFERNVQTTMSSIKKLEESLKFKDATKGFDNLDRSSKKVDMTHLGKGLEMVQAKFSAMQVIGTTALVNITNSAINAGKKIISALTIDPVKTGFQEYETKMGAIQTIMSNTASKGSTMEDVTRVIDKLNTYADKTIYNFSEMTRNIGTFTAAGVGLEESAAAIQGIANLAAASGSNSQQASTAMYQLSQAMAAGTVKLQDWNSVVNAGMGGEKFQEALKATAKDHGIAVDDMIKKNGSFRESLKEGWITTDVLNETLNKFTVDGAKNYAKSMMDSGKWTKEQADALIEEAQSMEDAATKVKTFTQLCDTLKESAQSGWGKTWELIVGDFEEAKELFTGLSDMFGGIINDMSDSRNNLLEGALSSNWQKVTKQVTEAGLSTSDLKDSLKEIAKNKGISVDKLVKEYGSFEKSLKAGWVTADMLSEALTGQTSKLNELSDAELKNKGYTDEEIKSLRKLADQAKNTDGSLDELADGLTKTGGRELLVDSLMNSLKAIGSILKPIGQAFRDVFPAKTSDQLYNLIVKIHDFTEKLKLSGDQSKYLRDTFKGVFGVFKIGITIITSFAKGMFSLIKAILPVGEGILATTGSLGEFIFNISEAISGLNIFENVFGLLAKILSPVANGIKNVFTSISDGVSNFGGIIGIIETVFDAIEKAFDKIQSLFSKATGGGGFDKLFSILNGGLFASLLIGVNKFIKALSGTVSDLKGSTFLGTIKKVLGGVGDALNAFTGQIKSKTLKNIAISIGILAAALFVLASIDPGKMTVALSGITGLFIELFASLAVFEKLMGSSGFKSINKVTWAMIKLSASLLILSAALKIMSGLSWNELAVGLTGMTVGLGVMAGVVNILPEKKVDSAAKAIKKLSVSVLILSVALKIMSTMSWGEIAIGLTAMAGGLTVMVAALYLLPKDIGIKALGMIALASAMVILGASLKIMSTMSWDEIGRSIVVLAGSLLVIAGALHIMPSALFGAAALLIISTSLVVLSSALKIMSTMSWTDIAQGLVILAGSLLIISGSMALMTSAIPGAFALLIVSASLAVLAPVLIALGAMSWKNILHGLVALAGALSVIGVAGLLLTPVIPTLLGLGVAITLFGIGCAAAGIGILAFSAGLSALAVSGVAVTAAIVNIAVALANGIIQFSITIAAGAPILAASVVAVVNAIIVALTGTIPALLAAAGVLLTAFLNFIVSYIPKMVDAGMKLIKGILQGIADNIGGIVDAATDIIVNFINGISRNIGRVIDAGVKLIISFINGMANAIRNNEGSMISAVDNLMNSMLHAIGAWFGSLFSKAAQL